MTASRTGIRDPAEPERWAVVLAVKPLRAAKSRVVLPSRARRQLVLAMARDTVCAVSRCTAVLHVFVVSQDRDVAAGLRGLPARILDREPPGGLNAAFRYGADVAKEQSAYLSVALMTADLPAATPDEIGTALGIAHRAMSPLVVPDRQGTGTTLLAVPSGSAPVLPQFGIGSLARHVQTGARVFPGAAPPGLTLDVDSVEDLHDAMALGVGPHTAAVVDAFTRGMPEHVHGLSGPVDARRGDRDPVADHAGRCAVFPR